ncbi:MAG: hypothetical protein IJP61_00265 [Treponema sp.]|jgi:hypothetical protein|nr:hypothetical protein [Treponema sp.]
MRFTARTNIIKAFLVFSALSAFALPAGFGKVKLGMSFEDAKSALKSDSQFGYRGDRDVSLSPSDGESVIETDTRITAPYSYISKSWLQFSDKKLYVLTMNLNEERVDYYSVFSKLCEKYGNPSEISPKKSVWRDSSVIMSLEKPLTLRFIDSSAFKGKNESSSVSKSASEQMKGQFLDSF